MRDFMTNWVEVYYAKEKAEPRQRGAKIKGGYS